MAIDRDSHYQSDSDGGRLAVPALCKHTTLLGGSAKRQAQACSHPSTGCCRRCAGKAPALTCSSKKEAAQ